jgi:hypothetical protein
LRFRLAVGAAYHTDVGWSTKAAAQAAVLVLVDQLVKPATGICRRSEVDEIHA